MYTCPRCHTDLADAREPDGVCFQCPSCRGKAIGFSLLRREITPEAARQIWSGQFRTTATQKCLCPICRHTMTQVTVSEPKGEVTLDICPPCSFVWLDKGEAELLPEAPRIPGEIDESRLSKDARVQLAMMDVELLRKKNQTENPEPDSEWKLAPALLGLPVEMQSQEMDGMPWATYILTAVIAAVSIGAFFNLRQAIFDWSLVPALAIRHFGLTWITSFFLHAGLFHLAGNLYFLILFGRRVETHIGPKRWLIVVFCAAILGDALHIIGHSHSWLPTMGASGGISGIIAYYACEFPRARIGLIARRAMRWIAFPAWVVILLWVGLQLLLVLKEYSGLGRVAALAHLGGGAAGFFCWVLWRKGLTTQDPQPGVPTAKIK